MELGSSGSFILERSETFVGVRFVYVRGLKANYHSHGRVWAARGPKVGAHHGGLGLR